jgi:hypothetical protein
MDEQTYRSYHRKCEETTRAVYHLIAPPERPFSMGPSTGLAPLAIRINSQTTLLVNPAIVTEFFQRASSAQLASRREVFDPGESRISSVGQVHTCVMNALQSRRFQASLQILGGIAEISAGYGMTFATGMFAAPIGHVVVVHGIDHFTSGLYSMITGRNKITATQLALEIAGLPRDIAGPVDAGCTIAGMGMGAKAAAQLVTFPQYKLPPPYLNDRYGRVALEEYKAVLRAQLEQPSVVNARLQGHVDKFDRPHASIGSGSTSAASGQISEWLGEGTRLIRNEAGDSVFLSKDGLRRLRFDFNRPYPHNNPHTHVEYKIGVNWEDYAGQIYPIDVPHN